MNDPILPTDIITDQKLADAFHAGDKSAFDTLVSRHRDRVFNLCQRLLGVRADTNDCSLETFVRARRQLRGFKSESTMLVWLYHIAVGLCMRRMSSDDYRKRASADPADAPRPQEGEAAAGGNPVAPVPDDGEQDEKENIVQRVIGSFEGEQKVLVVLRDLEGLSYEEIARVTGISLQRVSSQLAEARGLILDKMKELV